MTFAKLMSEYEDGVQLLRQSVSGMTDSQRRAKPVAGRWSTHEVVCHVADFELVNANRMKRVLAENHPILLSGDPDEFARGLAYSHRDFDEELQLIQLIRQQMAKILRLLTPDHFKRTGDHSEDGVMTLETLLRRTVDHIPHHIRFIEEKRQALSADH